MKTYLILLVSALMFLISCDQDEHFLSDKNYRKAVEFDFEQVRQKNQNRAKALFSVFDENISLQEAEALKFLYAYMPLSDLADYDAKFFLSQVRYALMARDEFSWGKTIPEDIFRHFVLPYRVNNENLDTARQVIFHEIKERIKGLSLREAALEVNHWCHEKVNYQSTDERTISPLAAIKSTFGRCGEESTFAVTALRAVGIPARQCYTPRWAHTDDNHAWVEVWVDGEWFFMGACEPEPELNMAWFTGPALRSMLVHSKAFGKYKGNETVIKQHGKFAEMNLLENYAPVKTIFVEVRNHEGNLVKDAFVEYQLYNYAEFYPIARKQTCEKGISQFKTGFGDLIVWAYSKNKFAYKKISVEKVDTVKLKLSDSDFSQYVAEYDIVPPVERAVPSASAKGAELNKQRLKQEDSIRNAYRNTFIKKDKAQELASNLDLDEEKVWNLLQFSYGNWENIKVFLEKTADDPKLKAYGIKLLELISKKDLRDVEAETLLGHMRFLFSGKVNWEPAFFTMNYVMNPRIANEKLVHYNEKLNNRFLFLQHPQKGFDVPELIEWIKNSIEIADDENYYNVPISPIGVMDLARSDAFSRDVFFVAVCRSFGIPARLEPITKLPQYHQGKWLDVFFEPKPENKSAAKGKIELIKDPECKIDLLYRTHFSLAVFENGRYNTLDYGWGTPFSKMDNFLALDEGAYLLITGNRQTNGSVLTKMCFFNVKENETTKVYLNLRNQQSEAPALAKLTEQISLSSTQKLNLDERSILAWIDPSIEPGKHFLTNLTSLSAEFEKRKGLTIYLIHKEEHSDLLAKYVMPKSVRLIEDNGFGSLESFKLDANLADYNSLPVVALIDKSTVYYVSAGYQIGIGEQLLKIIYGLEN